MYIGVIIYHKKGENTKLKSVMEGKNFREFLSNYNTTFYPLIEKKVIIDNVIIKRV